MKILGLYDGHNASVSLIDDLNVLAAVEEERLSRIKLHDGRWDGLPQRSFDEVFRISGVSRHDVDVVAVALENPFTVQMRAIKHLILQKNPRWLFFWLKKFHRYGPLYYFCPFTYQNMRKNAVKGFLRRNGLGDKRVVWLDHHLCHNASAYFTSGLKNDVLSISFDGRGDALCGRVYLCSKGKMKCIHETTYQQAIGHLYSTVTQYLGFKPVRHEGKITGLAAFGNQNSAVSNVMDRFFDFDGKNMSFRPAQNFATRPYPWISTEDVMPHVKSAIDSCNASREDIAAALQRKTEDVMEKFVAKMIGLTGVSDIALSGGVFSNVKVNWRVASIKDVDSVYVVPAMTDGGLSMGAAFYALSLFKDIEPITLNDVYFGPSYDDRQIQGVLEEYCDKVEFEKSLNVEKQTAQLIIDRKVVGRFDGRMEYGPRALGCRSILYDPQDKKVNDWLNKRLRRTEFMPFAPTALQEHVSELYKDYSKSLYAAKFMTIACEVTDYAAKVAPAVTHIDNTARPQILSQKNNPSYYKILKYFENGTGIPCFVNTSFNMHEEPIICTPQDAVDSFLEGRLDFLSIGRFIVQRKEK